MTASSDIRQEFLNHMEYVRGQRTDAREDESLRSDLVDLASCAKSGVASDDPIGLFWNLYAPFHYLRGLNDPVPELSEQSERLVLDLLESLYSCHQVAYVPDSERSMTPDKLNDLVTFLHIAAARAFRIKRSQGERLSEEVLGCFSEVERTMARLEPGMYEVFDSEDTVGVQLSANAVSSKVYAELGRVCQGEGRYADALHYLARAAVDSDYAVRRYLAERPEPSWSRRRDGEDLSEHVERLKSMQPSLAQRASLTLSIYRPVLLKGLDNISPAEIASIFLLLKEYGQTDSWLLVASDCRTFADPLDSGYMFGVDAYDSEEEEIVEWIEDKEGRWVTWGEFWRTARAWAEAQLSRNDYRKLREEDEKSASEDRLKNYFFDRNWSALPDRAKDRLITVDVIWNSRRNWHGKRYSTT